MSRFLLVAIVLLALPALAAAQSSWRIEGKSLLELKRAEREVLPLPKRFLPLYHYTYAPFTLGQTDRPRSVMHTPDAAAPKAYRYRDLAFFCRLEVQMEQLFKFPVKFRLGEVQYVERKEGKY